MNDDTKAGLEPLMEVPPPRRTDAAFARSVADDVRQRRAPRPLLFGGLALATAGAAAIFLVPRGPEVAVVVVDAGARVAVATPTVQPRASADFVWDDDGDFAIPSLDGSSDEELARLDRALDLALQKKL